MAHDHRVWLTILKTPSGYLTESGFTEDINSKDIIVLRSNTFGKWSSMKRRIEYFLERATLSENISKELYEHEAECQTIVYLCEHGFVCNGCTYRSDCQFWNGRRDQLELSRLY